MKVRTAYTTPTQLSFYIFKLFSEVLHIHIYTHAHFCAETKKL